MPNQRSREPVDVSSADAVTVWIQTQGYGVEHQTARVFGAYGFVARQGLTYRDRKTDKARDVDVLASARAERPGAVEMHVVVECKRSPRAWMTRTSAVPPGKGSQAWLPIAALSVREYLAGHPAHLDSLPLPKPVAFDVIETHFDRQDVSNPAYVAISQAVSAAGGLQENLAQFPNAAVFHPVVVLDGTLYRVAFVGTEVSVNEILHERVYWSGSHSLDGPVLVDVVTLRGLPDFAPTLREELASLAGDLSLANRTFPPDGEGGSLVMWGR
jgi:hypothetical protein